MPHLVKCPETSQDTTPDPARKLTLCRVPRSRNSDTRPGIELDEFSVKPLGKAIEKGAAAGDDDVAEQVRS